jgi:BMFP domain-containing protein YqiC
MDVEAANKRVAELEKRVAQLETRLDNQYEWNQNLLHRVGELERASESVTTR